MPKRSQWSLAHDDDDDDDDIDVDEDEVLLAAAAKRRRDLSIARQRDVRTVNVKFNPAVSLKSVRMTQTEGSLRLALSLLNRHLTSTNVAVALTAGEMTRKNKNYFPVTSFLQSLGFQTATPGHDWRDTYLSTRARFSLILHDEVGMGDVVTTLSSGRRFAAEVTGGPLEPTRSPTEHKLLRGVIARAITAEYAQPDDVIVAVVPRSERFRALARRWRELPRVASTGVSIALIDRRGTIDGCQEIADK